MKIGREIDGTNAPMPKAKEDEPRQPETSDVDEIFEPYEPKIRRSGTDMHLLDQRSPVGRGSFYPRPPDGQRKKFNVYAKTREECENELAKMIEEKKKETADLKEKAKTA